jgi:uncharacterized membrane protein
MGGSAMGDLLRHPMTICMVMGIVTVLCVFLTAWLNRKFHEETNMEERLAEAINEKVHKEQVAKCEIRFERGDRAFEKIKMALIAIYQQAGGNGPVLIKLLSEE